MKASMTYPMSQQEGRIERDGEPVTVPFPASAAAATDKRESRCSISVTIDSDQPIRATLTIEFEWRCDHE